MEEILFLLLPVAVLSGWWLGRRNAAGGREDRSLDLPGGYIRGLNYLLNEQQDKAIDLFIRMLDVDSDTVETHLALGSLFRRRGEVDRAIRIHQNLIARPTLNREQRALALYELGQDYMRAGLLDRAEALFSELVNNEPHTEAALQQLLDIYQQEKDWDNAIQIALRLETKTGQSQRGIVAHFYCEKAERARAQGESARALKLLKRAVLESRNCARASILEGQIEQAAGNYKAAIRAYRRVEEQDPEYLPEIIAPLTECYRAIGKIDEMVVFLRQNLARHAGISLMLALAELIRQEKGDGEAADFITDYLRQRPSVRGMDRLIELHVANTSETLRNKLQVLKDVTDQLIANKPVYKCSQCGFTGKSLHWRCPGCKQWNTVKPIHGVEGE
ncbi:MAG TPA: lipopolysaccharide assembly protein LapB [Chromatiales bacterium]|nr:lipopolysaccharide assembly protein LapB [Chromatiales bacterium]